MQIRFGKEEELTGVRINIWTWESAGRPKLRGRYKKRDESLPEDRFRKLKCILLVVITKSYLGI